MKKLFMKLKNNRGETIGETLVALLISSLALVMLAGAIATAGGIITRSSDTIEEYYQANETLISMKTGDENVSTTKVHMKRGETAISDRTVLYSKNTKIKNKGNPIVAFRIKK